ncbi:MAG TPA: response regulator transcription factor [Acidimicrobiia bacterium]|nr:response regulator transcription factor [Acidimicrobiia bacterium]
MSGTDIRSGQGGQVKPPRVFVVDDHPLVRSGVRRELEDKVDVVGTAGDVDEALAGIAAARPDVVLVDVHMPGGGGAELIRRVLAAAGAAGPPAAPATAAPVPRFLALSVSDAAEDVIAVIRAGARGYLTKTVSGGELAEAIGRVAAGDAVFSPRLAGFVLDAFAGSLPLPSDPELDQLTARERDVLRLIARGYAYKEVARRLNLSVKTVETHVSSVLRKLQLSNRHELTRWATERRLV